MQRKSLVTNANRLPVTVLFFYFANKTYCTAEFNGDEAVKVDRQPIINYFPLYFFFSFLQGGVSIIRNEKIEYYICHLNVHEKKNNLVLFLLIP